MDSASVLACEGRGVVQNSELGGRGGEGARVEQVLEQDVARVLDSDRAGLEHAEPRLTHSCEGLFELGVGVRL